jgi:dCTP deaminase
MDEMILNDVQITGLAGGGMISPFVGESTKGPGGTSYGLSSYGYDIRVGDEWVTYRRNNDEPLDPANILDTDTCRTVADEFILRQGQFVLACTMETIAMPRDCVGMVMDKSSLARCGITLQTTVLEPEWRGQITLEIFNNSPRPVLLRAGQGIAQVIFHRGEPCFVSYADRKGKYQDQAGVTLPRCARAREGVAPVGLGLVLTDAQRSQLDAIECVASGGSGYPSASS